MKRYSANVNFDLEQAQEILARTPATLQALLGGLSPAWIRANEGDKTFSPFDVVGHLIDADETNWLSRARVILEAQTGSSFAAFDRFRHQTRNVERDLTSLLAEFTSLRAANLAELRAWALTAVFISVEKKALFFLNYAFDRCLVATRVSRRTHVRMGETRTKVRRSTLKREFLNSLQSEISCR